MVKVVVDLYKWEGKFFLFKIKSKCGECSLNEKIIDSVSSELENLGIEVELRKHPWLDNWFKVLFKGGYHAPIILVNGKLLKQEKVITREELKDRIIKEAVLDYKISLGVHIFTLPTCKYCKKAKKLLKDNGYEYVEHDILNDSLEMQRMLSLVLGKVHPITVPQIFIDKKWIGGYDDLIKYLKD